MTTATQQDTQATTEQTTAQKKRDQGETVWFIVLGFVMCGFFLATKL